MATFVKRGTKFNVQVRLKGRFSSRTFHTRIEAKEWARNEEHKLSHSTDILLGKTFGDALRRYMVEETKKKKGARWESLRIGKLEKDDIASVQLADLTSVDISDWIKLREKEGLKGSSINRELSIISAVLIKARDYWRWMESSPMKTISKCKEPPHRDRIITDEEKGTILAALGYEEEAPVITARHVIAVAFLFALETAMRYGEIWKMDWKDIDWKKRFVRLFDTKNGENRDVALSQRAIQLLQKLTPAAVGKVMLTKTTSSEVIFRRALELAGYKGQIHFHDTRHTAITRLALKLDVLTLAKLTGHRDPRMLMIYYNPTPESIADRLG